jgi:hypothetical protein
VTFVKAKNVADAIAIAMDGMRSGAWNLFRGQSNASWPVTSSAERLTDAGREEAVEFIERFHAWATTIPGMSSYVTHSDSLWAIAQHYGLPTFFIDFSDDPRVATFFACDSKSTPAEGQLAAIICLNSADFERFWKDIGPAILKGAQESDYPQFIRIDVANLWRLQQQKGSFLWNVVGDIERFYDFDRIVFPGVRNDPALPKRAEIYPIHQSELEKLLTRFFMNEQLLVGNKAIDRSAFHVITVPPSPFEMASWWQGDSTVSEDWRDTDPWDKERIEHSSAALPGASIKLDSASSLDQAYGLLRSTLSAVFIEANRNQVLDLRRTEGGPFEGDIADLVAAIGRLWNGMRTLPYTATEIYTAMANSLTLFSLRCQGVRADQAYGNEGVDVEMSSNADGRGAYSRGAVTRRSLMQACNPAFLAAARKKLSEGNEPCENETDEFIAELSLHLPARPRERFTFTGLRKLMVEQLIPTQIVWRASPSSQDALRTVIYFSPNDLLVFGLA